MSIFPLSVSSSSRYFQTAAGAPFLFNECTGWGLFQSLSTANAKDFVDRRANQGFNTMKISVISFDTSFPGSPPDWQGVPPFTTPGDFSTPNSTYFSHVDDMLDYLRTKGFFVWLVPDYLGYYAFTNQGWGDTINTQNNTTKMASFGTYLQSRYGSRDHVGWLLGGDQVPGTGVGSSVNLSLQNSLKNALLTGNTLPVAGHYAGDYQIGGGSIDPIPGGMLSTDFANDASVMSFRSLYSYNPSSGSPPYSRILTGYNASPTLPTGPIDQSYESGPGIGQPQGDPLTIRRKLWQAMCSGACSLSYCYGSLWYQFSDWVSGSPGQSQAVLAYQFWSSIPQHTLVPDQSSSVFTSGRGTYLNDSYICGASTPTLATAYFPNGVGSSLVVNMSTFSTKMRARWFDPTASSVSTGFTLISNSLPNSGTHSFSTPGGNSGGDSDWLLILDSVTSTVSPTFTMAPFLCNNF